MNEALSALVDSVIPDMLPELRAVMKDELARREQTLCDQLRLRATVEGLAPSITALTLIEIGMGDQPSTEEVQLLQQQAATERATINEAIRKFTEGGGE